VSAPGEAATAQPELRTARRRSVEADVPALRSLADDPEIAADTLTVPPHERAQRGSGIARRWRGQHLEQGRRIDAVTLGIRGEEPVARVDPQRDEGGADVGPRARLEP
jgi:hypothetical protein